MLSFIIKLPSYFIDFISGRNRAKEAEERSMERIIMPAIEEAIVITRTRLSTVTDTNERKSIINSYDRDLYQVFRYLWENDFTKLVDKILLRCASASDELKISKELSYVMQVVISSRHPNEKWPY